MEAVQILNTAETIRKQLLCNNLNILLSWGITHLVAVVKNDMAALKFNVRARLHKGSVIIAYDEGSDTYQIFLRTHDAPDRCIADEAYCDNLVDIIDHAIESGDDPAEYSRFCEAEFHKLLQGNIL